MQFVTDGLGRRWGYMKRGILVLTLLALASCGDATGPNSDTMSALIDGDPFVATIASAERWGEGSGTTITLEGDDEKFRGIGIDFFDPGAPGTVTPWRAEVTMEQNGWLSYEDVGSRSVSISVLTANRIEGTFSLTLISGVDTVRVTDGRFDLEVVQLCVFPDGSPDHSGTVWKRC